MDNRSQKKILVTGAFGNIGTYTVRELLSRGYAVRAFDLKTGMNKKSAAAFGDQIEIVWGDISNPSSAAGAVAGVDYVVHLAFILPTLSETNPALAESVNIGGTGNIIQAMKLQKNKPGILLASSYAVYGDTRGVKGLVTLKTPVKPSNNYTHHKVSIETAVKKSGLPWIIFRFGAVLCADTILKGKFDSLIFEQPPDAHQEFIHTADAARAIANAIETKNAWKKIHLISGGSECRLEYRDLINRSLEAMGIGSLPDSVFSPVALQGGAWMDTSESQKLLKYQRCTYDAHCRQIIESAGPRRRFIQALGPVIRWYLKRMSPFYKKRKPITETLQKKIKGMRRYYAVSSVTSLILGLWTLVAPGTFWGTIGISGSDPIVQAIYGGAICGEGIISTLGFFKPLRYIVIFQYMIAYKAVVCIGLIPRLIIMDSPPIAAWFIVAAWAFAGIQSAMNYPFGMWREVIDAMKDE